MICFQAVNILCRNGNEDVITKIVLRWVRLSWVREGPGVRLVTKIDSILS